MIMIIIKMITAIPFQQRSAMSIWWPPCWISQLQSLGPNLEQTAVRRYVIRAALKKPFSGQSKADPGSLERWTIWGPLPAPYPQAILPDTAQPSDPDLSFLLLKYIWQNICQRYLSQKKYICEDAASPAANLVASSSSSSSSSSSDVTVTFHRKVAQQQLPVSPPCCLLHSTLASTLSWAFSFFIRFYWCHSGEQGFPVRINQYKGDMGILGNGKKKASSALSLLGRTFNLKMEVYGWYRLNGSKVQKEDPRKAQFKWALSVDAFL